MDFTGTITDIRFRNEENGYTVATMKTDDGSITIVGNAAHIKENDHVTIEGDLVFHDVYGEQIKFSSLKVDMPSNENGIISYLSSGLIPYIGPKTAKNIVERFGMDSLRVLQEEPEKLLEIRGIGRTKLDSIVEAYKEQREISEIMMFLSSYGISQLTGLKLFRKYGAETLDIIKSNPYRMFEDIVGIGFKKADEVAEVMGFDKESPVRIEAGLKFALLKSLGEGNTYMPLNVLVSESHKLLEVKIEYIEEVVKHFLIKDDIYASTINDEVCIYFKPYQIAENYVANKLLEISTYKDLQQGDFENMLTEVEKELDIFFAEEQRQSILNSFNNGVSVITGGPGTGKTTVINGIIRICLDTGLDFQLAAPTGRASKRMTEATGYEAKTIHRLLEYSFGDETTGTGFQRNEEYPLTPDVLIIDEASMIDILLMRSLLKAVLVGTRLVLVGDVDQLPSVGAGNVLSDIINSNSFSVTRLNEIFRQAGESMIVVNAHKINSGEYPLLNEKDKDFYFIQRESQTNITKTIIELLNGRLTNYYGVDALRGVQVLSPMKKGEAGVFNLNRQLQAILNPEHETKEEKRSGEYIFRVGDKVMQTKNNYSIKWKLIKGNDISDTGEGIYNGDIGYITNIDDGIVEVLFDGDKLVEYDFSELDELVLSYAITIHKSQGSEFPVVVVPISYGPPILLNRNLIYTAVTRAKKLVVLVGDVKYLRSMIGNTTIKKRYSSLDVKIQELTKWRS